MENIENPVERVETTTAENSHNTVESLMDESRNEPEQTRTQVEDSSDLVDWIQDQSTHSDLLELIRLRHN